jgi:hypothetical protein
MLLPNYAKFIGHQFTASFVDAVILLLLRKISLSRFSHFSCEPKLTRERIHLTASSDPFFSHQ